jgi:hypothetical protein
MNNTCGCNQPETKPKPNAGSVIIRGQVDKLQIPTVSIVKPRSQQTLPKQINKIKPNTVRVGNTVTPDNIYNQYLPQAEEPRKSTLKVIDHNATRVYKVGLVSTPTRPLINAPLPTPNKRISIAFDDMPHITRTTRKRIVT